MTDQAIAERENFMRNSLPFAMVSLAVTAAIYTPALAQTPTAAQQQAIRSSCVADYRANCSSVPSGGMQALVCLEQHESKLSAACKSAVEAVDAAPDASVASTTPKTPPTPTAKPTNEAASTAKTEGAAPKSESVTMGKEPATTSTHPGPALSFRQEMRIAAGACARDFRLFCPNLPVGHGNVLFCLKVHGPKLEPNCRAALVEAGEVF
jgi:hypothetical protein